MSNLPDLQPYRIPELEKLQEQIADRLVVLRKEVAAELRERFAREAEEAGLSIDELYSSKAARKAKKSSPRIDSEARYRNPANPSQTWTGNGRQPKWVIEYLKGDSNSLEDLAIPESVRDAGGKAA